MSRKKAENAAERVKRIEQEGMKPDGKWNRRVVRHPCGSLCIHEVHYQNGIVAGWSESCSEAVDAEDGISGLRAYVEATYEQSLDALDRSILEWSALPHGAN